MSEMTCVYLTHTKHRSEVKKICSLDNENITSFCSPTPLNELYVAISYVYVIDINVSSNI